jgi:hypothetical protein
MKKTGTYGWIIANDDSGVVLDEECGTCTRPCAYIFLETLNEESKNRLSVVRT